jgi:formylglycine-generating enzyme required for sulfatase activity
MHSAAEWLLRHWKCEDVLRKTHNEIISGSRPPERRWFITGQGLTMALIPTPQTPPAGWPGPDHQFAMATREVTVRQFQQFAKACNQEDAYAFKQARRFSPDPDGPVVSVDLYEAAQFCRWLSDEEGVPEDQCCYPAVETIERCRSEKKPLELPTNYLKRTGYRVPLDCEWEVASRTNNWGSSRAHGDSAEKLAQYAWYLANAKNRAWPGGLLKPNDFGLFDMYGNVIEWTLPSDALVQEPGAGGVTKALRILPAGFYHLRGGSFNSSAQQTGSGGSSVFEHRALDLNGQTNPTIGFRVVRTWRANAGAGK